MDKRSNLAPIALRQQISARKVIMNWGLVCCLVVGFALLDLTWLALRIRVVRDEVAVVRAEVLPIQDLIAKNSLSLSQRQASEKRLNYLRSALPNDSALQILGAVAQGIRSSKLVEGDHISPNLESDSQRVATLESISLLLPFDGLVSSEPKLEVRARTQNDGGTVTFMDNLRASDWLANVTLKASGRSPTDEQRFVHVQATPFNSGIKEP
jgi:hypothetical protein